LSGLEYPQLSTQRKIEKKLVKQFQLLFPFEFEIAVSKAKGHYGNPMEYLEVELTKSSRNKKILDSLS